MAGRHGEFTGAGELPLVAPGPGEVARPQQRDVGLLRRLASVDVLGLLGLVLLILVWWALAHVVPTTALPWPQSVAARIARDFFSAPEMAMFGVGKNGLLANLIYTTENVLIAVTIGSLVGSLAGLASARIELVRAIIDPIVLTAGTIPVLVTAPFFLIWFGVNRGSALLLVALYVSTILYLFAQRAANNLDPVYEDEARTLGASQSRIIRDLLIPGTLPEVLAGIRIALAGAWGLETIAELLGSQVGLGKIIQVMAQQTDAEGILAALIVLGAAAVLFDTLAAYGIRTLTRWRAG